MGRIKGGHAVSLIIETRNHSLVLQKITKLFLAKNKNSRAPAEQFQFLAAQNLFQKFRKFNLVLCKNCKNLAELFLAKNEKIKGLPPTLLFFKL